MLQLGEFLRNPDAKGRRQIHFAVKPRFLMSTVLTLGLCVVLFQKQLPGKKFQGSGAGVMADVTPNSSEVAKAIG